MEHFEQKIGEFKAYESSIYNRLQSLQEIYDFNTRFRAYRNKLIGVDKEYVKDGLKDQQKLTEALKITRNFLKLIDENKECLQSNKVLPMNVYFEEVCNIEKILIKDTSLKGD